MSSFQRAMPTAVMNLGGEMLYILQQRLNAQNIPPEKSLKVLEDIVHAMFSASFIDSLFKPQEIYTLQSIRAIFDKVAHSSIMRLSTSSMDKLYDLMTMGLKHQVITAPYPQDIQYTVLNHLNAIEAMLRGGTEATVKLVRNAIEKTKDHFATFEPIHFHHLKQALLHLLQGKRIKVSLFLQDKIQSSDGTFIFPTGEEMLEKMELPGQIRLFEGGAQTKVLKLGLPQSQEYKKSTTPRAVYISLGSNLYAKDRKKAAEPAKEEAPAPAAAATPSSAAFPEPSPTKRSAPVNPEQAKSELNLLAGLVGSKAPAADTFKLNFGGDNFADTEEVKASSSGPNVRTLVFDGKREPHLEHLMKEFSVSGPEPAAEGDDLLDLMDSA
uniref:OSCP1 n=1 Tax=Palpitomonas bilix TaxID=652834 RepID=A0A7S3D0J4_9EUKA|mmetsp:Transcript_16180/g.40937  ORF Transcript_16180/g.40937 Transcript_16180/m.40937 type:complete len:382 (+) Transcript_16180:93-1238(+)|eukprot:CAMPEP_0113881708 /NCGR_PEP_ID=MMETSP0780_2-20120614/8531_1 /TAXON_ID=652834 /ORGANISM="Palpitomonas bilix" /LENGTH=381 /DNA_ID=CAMNT_0000868605 /DNA_START=32 /DNA_END=1177 /DNA_ORIENTATION=- /assembly_acc=CAM_ASM_000599